ncbi:hypothetical protein CKA32_002946 [Geitlerinema sp. FC II]|nr:hypothetical protein CKA32_002946 [Geitlerinema sp. FC II]
MAIAGDTPSLALAFPKPLPAIAHIRESFSNGFTTSGLNPAIFR